MIARILSAAVRMMVSFGLVLVLVSTSSAQAVATNSDQLRFKVKNGDVLSTTYQSGDEADVSSSERLAAPTPLRAAIMTSAWSERVEDRQGPRLTRFAIITSSASRAGQEPEPKKRSWIGRHPVLFGTMVGFGAGFLIGYLPGDDGVFDDFTAEFNGLVMGAAGAGTGAIAGAFAK